MIDSFLVITHSLIAIQIARGVSLSRMCRGSLSGAQYLCLTALNTINCDKEVTAVEGF